MQDAAQFCSAVHGSAAPPEATGRDSGVDGSRGAPEEAHKVLPAANLRTGKGAQGARRAGTHDQQAAGLLGSGSRAAGGDRVCFELAAAAEPAESEETRFFEQAEPIKTAVDIFGMDAESAKPDGACQLFPRGGRAATVSEGDCTSADCTATTDCTATSSEGAAAKAWSLQERTGRSTGTSAVPSAERTKSEGVRVERVFRDRRSGAGRGSATDSRLSAG